jgi:cell fate regulator YaaT (PSP1 superfamily)
MKPNVISVHFQEKGKLYHFDAGSLADLQPGDYVVVNTTRGRQIGQVVELLEPSTAKPEGGLKPVERLATAQDLLQRQQYQQKGLEATIACRQKATEIGLDGVKIVAAEYSFDGDRLIFIFSAETEERMDLTILRKAMQRSYRGVKVEMRQVGPRDVAKYLCGMGACSIEKRCCCLFLTEFSPISIRMAKAQGISLTPSEITGMCGRLRCCLLYEYEQYAEARKTLPKEGKRVKTAHGMGRVTGLLPLQQVVIVDLPEIGRTELTVDQIEPWDEKEAQRRLSKLDILDGDDRASGLEPEEDNQIDEPDEMQEWEEEDFGDEAD